MAEWDFLITIFFLKTSPDVPSQSIYQIFIFFALNIINLHPNPFKRTTKLRL